MTAITMLTAMFSLQLGSLGVVAQTHLSGISSLPLGAFLLMMPCDARGIYPAPTQQQRVKHKTITV